jgi:hypothetical protein
MKILKSDNDEVGQSVHDVVATWRYRPLMVDGQPKPFCYILRFIIGPSPGTAQ